ncbi:isocitrate lyase/PEP mutase family protein [Rahnella woolbedingensis]|uniref:Isocitrate lyase/phosphoenolpyruvate mutase family protein n=1 Tax=Rahnella woolbedingensis TaxID=1510574 RepID=A0A419N2W5_9GAMM|nr:isocitrate lyase/phosphoenolpyruvate mutase family protein [Rahnella woolbedingensis]RJT35143.1 isocitrate lyase/phosphoenolpyruvate mutase family protein [Rahnella woolbedingensis]
MKTPSASLFRELHLQDSPLKLPNAWDAGSARQIERLGATAIATTSAGVAWSLGYRDGNQLPVEEYVARAASIFRIISVPLSADIEGGYSEVPATVALSVSRFIDAGVVGINIEDGAGLPHVLCRKIEAIRAASVRLGVDLYINVRTDVYARNLVPAAGKPSEVITRAQAYRKAGADGIFVLGLADAAEMRAIADGTDLLLNVAVWPGLPPLSELADLGVRRLSAGSWLPQSLWAQNARLVSGFLQEDNAQAMIADAAPYSAINALF